MIDLKIIQMADVLPVTSVDLESAHPPTLRLLGRGFQYAQAVYVNDTEILPRTAANPDGFAVSGGTRIAVPLPQKLWGTPVSSVNVFGNTVNLAESTKITFALDSFLPVRGISMVVQQFLRLLVTTPGSDLFAKTQGGGLGYGVGATLTDENAQGLAARILLAVQKCTQDIRDAQTNQSIPPEERLVDVVPVDISYDRVASVVNVQLEFQTEVARAIVKLGV